MASIAWQRRQDTRSMRQKRFKQLQTACAEMVSDRLRGDLETVARNHLGQRSDGGDWFRYEVDPRTDSTVVRSSRNELRQGYKLKPLFAQPGNELIQGADRLALVPVEPPHVTVVENDDGARLNPPQHSRCYDFRARPGDVDREHVAHHSAIPHLFHRVEGAAR